MNKNFLLGGTILVLVVSVILTMKFLNNFEDNLDKEAIEKANNQIITENKPLTQEKSSFKDTLKEDTDKNETLVEEETPAAVNEVIENEKEEVVINKEEAEEKELSTFDKKEEPIKLEPIIVTPDNSNNEETNELVNENITNKEETNVDNKNE